MRPNTSTTSGNSGGTSSRSSDKNRNTGERKVRQAEYTVHREAVQDRLDTFEASAADN